MCGWVPEEGSREEKEEEDWRRRGQHQPSSPARLGVRLTPGLKWANELADPPPPGRGPGLEQGPGGGIKIIERLRCA